MTNFEIITKINELLDNKDNFCDYILKLKKLNKEYKKSNFYFITKISLKELIREYQLYMLYQKLNLDNIFIKIQEYIDELDVTHLYKLINEIQNTFSIDLENQKDFINGLNSVLNNNYKGE